MIHAPVPAARVLASPSSSAPRLPTAESWSSCRGRRAALSRVWSSPGERRKAEVGRRTGGAQQEIGHGVHVSFLQRGARQQVDGKLTRLPRHGAGTGKGEGKHIAP